MVAVAPYGPLAHGPQGPRSAKPAAASADFARLLEQHAEESRPAAQTEASEEERAPAAADQAKGEGEEEHPAIAKPRDANPAPAKKIEGNPTPPKEGEEQAPPAAGKDEEERKATPSAKEHPLASPASPLPQQPAPQFVPLPETGTTKLSALQGQAPLIAPEALGTTGAPQETPAPPKGAKTETKQRPGKGETEVPTGAESLPKGTEKVTELEKLPAKSETPAAEKHASKDLLSFDELMHPDLKVDAAPEPILDHLQQAMNAALLDESAQVVLPQVVRGLATIVRDGMSEMRLKLQPEDLGDIEVRVRTSEGVVRGEMMVQNPEVKQLLDHHLDRLREALHQQGLDLRNFDIGLTPDGRFNQPDRSWQGSRQGGERRPTAAVEAPETPAPMVSVNGGQAVDYLA